MSRVVPQSTALLLIEGLHRAGWLFQHIRDDNGELTEIRAGYAWPSGWADALILYGETDATACRCDPDQAVVWHREGTVVDLIACLLDLPAPGERFAPHLALGRAAALWLPSGR